MRAVGTNQRKRPVGVKLTAMYHGLWGSVLLPVGCLASMAPDVPGASPYAGALGFLITILGGAMLAGAYGLWTLEPWGRQFNIGLAVICIPFCLMTLAGIALTDNVTAGDRAAATVEILLAFAIWRYLASDTVKRWLDGHWAGNE